MLVTVSGTAEGGGIMLLRLVLTLNWLFSHCFIACWFQFEGALIGPKLLSYLLDSIGLWTEILYFSILPVAPVSICQVLLQLQVDLWSVGLGLNTFLRLWFFFKASCA